MNQKPLIIDTHCHLDDEKYDEDLEQVIKNANDYGVRGILIPGADINDLPKARKISYMYENIFFAAGVHPYHADEYNEEILREYLNDKKCIAVGECGLDYYRLPENESEKLQEKKLQKEIFISQINLAREFNKPLIVHVRDANQDSFDILKENAVRNGIKGVLHCYNASDLLLNLEGFYFGIGGVLTFPNAKNLVEILSRIPKDKLIFETDAPYLAPSQHRGKRNEPAFTYFVAKKAAEILHVNENEIIKLATNNAKDLFKEFSKTF